MIKDDIKSAQEIRERLEEKARAYAACDVDRVMDLYENSPTVSVFDPGPPDEYQGYEAVTQTIGNFILGAETMELTYQGDRAEACGDLGTAWSLVRIKTRLKNGVNVDIICRQTNIWRRSNGVWRVIHEHNSVTMSPEQADALFSQDPELAATLGKNAAP
ncbi:Ketosteroid isomerase-like protein [Frankia sp. Hr75.2]|nr:Ketosteroid isomerase-like protein [Frankia sp. Hr75.2]